MKNIFITSLIIVICCTTAACDNVNVNMDSDIACDEGTIKCVDNSHYVMCHSGKWDDSKTECAIQDSCNNNDIATCLGKTNTTDNSCEQGSVKCLDGGYSICTNNEWAQRQNCPSGSTCTTIEECFKQSAENQCEEDQIQCESDNSAQYRICKDNQWGELQNCPDSQICSSYLHQCVDAQVTPTENCETGVIKCHENTASYVICNSDNKWSDPIGCPSKKTCSGNIIQCFRTDEPSTDNNSVIQCDTDNDKQYVICTNGLCGMPKDCPNTTLGCKNNIGNCFVTPEAPIQTCVDGMVRCDPDGTKQYQICRGNEWGEPRECPNGNQCSTNIDDCFQSSANECIDGMVRCAPNEPKQYQICRGNNWGEPSECPNGNQCSENIDDCFQSSPNACEDGMVRCDPQMTAHYQICDNNQWKDADECPTGNDCTNSLEACFIASHKDGDLQCSENLQELQIYKNDSWETQENCINNKQICSNLYGEYMCHLPDACIKDPYSSYQVSDKIYTCENNAYHILKDASECKLSNDNYMCIYDNINDNFISIRKVNHNNAKNQMKEIKDHYSDYNSSQKVCLKNGESDSDAFQDGSTICIYDNTKYTVFECNQGWQKTIDCGICVQTGVIIEKNWKPSGWNNQRNLYKLTALCIPDNYGLHCSDDNHTIQFTYGDNTSEAVADCASIGLKCEPDNEGKPQCK